MDTKWFIVINCCLLLPNLLAIQTLSVGSPLKLQTKTVVPSNSVQNIYPDTRYDGFEKIVVQSADILLVESTFI